MLLLQLLVLLLRACDGLYDPVHHIASARIYGNIDAFAYYYLDLLVGTPPQRVSVIVDTGSGVTAFPCRSCGHCGKHIDPSFDFELSSSANWITCDKSCQTGCRKGHCGYHQGYTEGSSITGWWFTDTVRLGDAIQHNPSVPSRFGCHQDENKLFYTQKANGIMGIRPPGKGTPTLLQDLFSDHEHINSNVFSLCLAEWGGRMVVGGYNASYHTGEILYIPLSTASGYYGVPLTEMQVDGQVVSTRWGTAMIDSGTTYVYMATAAYQSLRKSIESYCEKHSNCEATHKGTCWEVSPKHGVSKFPDVEVSFNSIKTAWVPSAYLYRKGSSTRWCYSFQDDGARANTVLGAAWMLHQEVIFDMPEQRIGIAQARCPEFQKRPDHDTKDLEVPTAAPGTEVAFPAKRNDSALKPLVFPVVKPGQDQRSSRFGNAKNNKKGSRKQNRRAVYVVMAIAGILVVGLLVVIVFLIVGFCSEKQGLSRKAESGRSSVPAATKVGVEDGGDDDDEEDPLVAVIEGKTKS